MKAKTTVILAVLFAGLLAFVLFVEKKPAEPGAGPASKLTALSAADVEGLTLTAGADAVSLRKDDKGEWTVTAPVAAKADTAAVESLVSALSDLAIQRVVEAAGGDPKSYDIPQKEASLKVKGKAEPVRVLFGSESKIDGAVYAQLAGDPRIVLLASSVKTSLDKKLIDLRQKDVFRFEAKDAASIKLTAKDVRWEARKADGEWMLTSPLRAPAKESQITTLLESLAGLRAKEFAAEAKTPQDLKARGLDKPEYSVTVGLPAAGREIVFALHKDADKTYATTSQSTHIIVPEADILFDLERKPADLRESKVAVFSSWQADRLTLRKGALAIEVHKAGNEKWYFDAAEKDEADASKIDTFLRRIEGLEAAEFIDAPKGPAEYGLDKPTAELTIRTKDTMAEPPVEKTASLTVGKVDAATKQAFIRNARRTGLVKADAAFLDEIPKDRKDWQAPPPAAPVKK